MQKKLKDLKEVLNKTNANIKNALFVGATAELHEMLHKKIIETNKDIPIWKLRILVFF